MKIIPAIKALQKAVAANAAVPGSGIGVERTPRGTRIFLKEEPRGGASAWRGMFEMEDRVELEDGEQVHKVKVFNGNDPEGDLAGVVHVNRQPFEVPVTDVAIAADGTRHYVYLEFTAPREATDTEDVVPAAVAVVAKTTLMESTEDAVYHLIGQAWVEDESLHLSQDHVPGNVYMEWYGPCLGLLETEDD
jgi:hypothetical protein